MSSFFFPSSSSKSIYLLYFFLSLKLECLFGLSSELSEVWVKAPPPPRQAGSESFFSESRGAMRTEVKSNGRCWNSGFQTRREEKKTHTHWERVPSHWATGSVDCQQPNVFTSPSLIPFFGLAAPASRKRYSWINALSSYYLSLKITRYCLTRKREVNGIGAVRKSIAFIGWKLF